jgi:hypothetical protein
MKTAAILTAVVIGAAATCVLADSSCSSPAITSGEYRNLAYGFSVSVPPGVKGFGEGPRCFENPIFGCGCFPDHGRNVPLGEDAYITVFAYFADEGLPDRLLYDIETFQNGARISPFDFSIEKMEPSRLAGLRAFHYVASRHEEGSIRYREAVVAESGRKGHGLIAYTVAIEGPEETYRAKRSAFEAILRSWRVTQIP